MPLCVLSTNSARAFPVQGEQQCQCSYEDGARMQGCQETEDDATVILCAFNHRGFYLYSTYNGMIGRNVGAGTCA